MRLVVGPALHGHVHVFQKHRSLYAGLLDRQVGSSYCSENGCKSLTVIQTIITMVATTIRNMKRTEEVSVAARRQWQRPCGADVNSVK